MPKRQSKESEVQKAFFQLVSHHKGEEWRNIIAIPNQGFTGGQIWGVQRKREGMSTGFPDIAVLVPRGGYHGLFIELKYPPNKPTKSQVEWLTRLKAQGYRAICLSTTDPLELYSLVKKYFSMES